MSDRMRGDFMKKNSVKGKAIGDDGFSLVELIVVIAIMVALVATIAIAVTRYVDKARFATNVTNVRNGFEAIQVGETESGSTDNALFLFYTSSGSYDKINSPGNYHTYGTDMDNYDINSWDYDEMLASHPRITKSTNFDWYIGFQSGSVDYVGAKAWSTN